MLDRLHDFAEKIKRNKDFTCTYQKGKPADTRKIRLLAGRLHEHVQEVPESLLTLYRECDGLTFRWTSRQVTHPDYLASGEVEFDSIDLLISRILPSEPILLDRVNDTNETWLELGSEGIRLLYHDEYLERDVPLPIDLDKYFELLDITRGLHPWREIVANATSLPVDADKRQHFADSMRLLFGEADAASFVEKSRLRP